MTGEATFQFHRVTAVLGVLVALSAAAWFVVQVDMSAQWAAVGLTLLVIGFVKAGLVGLEFMGLRDAPSPLRNAFLAWLLLTATTLVLIAVL